MRRQQHIHTHTEPSLNQSSHLPTELVVITDYCDSPLVKMASCSRGARTPTASSVWGRGSPASCTLSPSSLWRGFLWQRSRRGETTALPSRCRGLCLAGARTKLGSWVLMINKVWITSLITSRAVSIVL